MASTIAMKSYSPINIEWSYHLTSNYLKYLSSFRYLLRSILFGYVLYVLCSGIVMRRVNFDITASPFFFDSIKEATSSTTALDCPVCLSFFTVSKV